METMTANLNISGNSGTVSQGVTTTSDGATSISSTIPAATNDVEIDLGSIVKANVKAFFLMAQFTSQNLAQATAPVVVYSNQPGPPGSGTADDTWDMTPNVFGYWDHQSPFPNPMLVATYTKLYVNNPNAVPCTLIFRTIEDVTP